MRKTFFAAFALLSGALWGAEAKAPADGAKAVADAKPAEAKKPSEAPKAPAEIVTRTFILKYAKADEVTEALNKLCDKLKVSEAAVAFPESHSVAIAGPKNVVEACAKIVGEIDRKPKQVYVEARFFDIVAGDVGSLGIDWTMLGSPSISLGESTLGVDGNASATFAGGKGTDLNHFYNGKLSVSGLRTALAALRMNRDNHMFANPRVVVASGKKAVVDISTKRPNVIISSKRDTGNGNNTLDIDMQLKEVPGKDKLMFAGEAFFWWGVGLMVEPYVGEDGIITAKIVPNVSSLSDISMQEEGHYVSVSSSGGDDNDDQITSKFPIIDVKRIETEFSLRDGETAVIGGLAKTEHEDIDTGVPFLSKIPGLRAIFGQTTRINRQREILVLVTMGIVDPDAPDKKAGMPKNAFISREFIDGVKKEPGDLTREELEQAFDRNRRFFRFDE